MSNTEIKLLDIINNNINQDRDIDIATTFLEFQKTPSKNNPNRDNDMKLARNMLTLYESPTNHSVIVNQPTINSHIE